MGRYNLRDGLAADQRQDQPTLRTHPTRRPRENVPQGRLGRSRQDTLARLMRMAIAGNTVFEDISFTLFAHCRSLEGAVTELEFDPDAELPNQ